MSHILVKAQQNSFNGAVALLERYLEICPDNIWEEKFGGWPVWQQFYHALSTWDFILGTNRAILPNPCPAEVAMLSAQGTATISKADMRALMLQGKDRVHAFTATLTDAALSQPNHPLTSALKHPFTQTEALTMLCSHTLYHLGSCDAALRQHGLSGAF